MRPSNLFGRDLERVLREQAVPWLAAGDPMASISVTPRSGFYAIDKVPLVFLGADARAAASDPRVVGPALRNPRKWRDHSGRTVLRPRTIDVRPDRSLGGGVGVHGVRSVSDGGESAPWENPWGPFVDDVLCDAGAASIQGAMKCLESVVDGSQAAYAEMAAMTNCEMGGDECLASCDCTYRGSTTTQTGWCEFTTECDVACACDVSVVARNGSPVA